MTRYFLYLLAFGGLVTRLILGLPDQATRSFPNRPIRIVVPYLAGGGTDTFARIIQKALERNNRLSVPIVIENRNGGSATIGSRFVKNSKPDGYRILCHHEGLIATKLAKVVPYGPEAFEPIAQTGDIVLLMIVRADSPYRSLTDLLQAARKSPHSIRIGANQGSPAYFLCKQMLREFPGAEFNFVSASGSKRITYILGEKLEGGIFSLAEYLAFRKSGDVPDSENILAIGNFSQQRHPAIADVPTSREQGLQTSASNAYYFWAPLETPPNRIRILADALQQAMQDPVTIRELERLALEPTFRTGDELKRHLAKRTRDFEVLATDAQQTSPGFEWWAAVAVGILSILAFLETRWKPIQRENVPVIYRQWIPAGLVVLVLILEIVSMQLSVPFLYSTPTGFLLVGIILRLSSSPAVETASDAPFETRFGPWRPWVLDLFAVGLILALGIEYLFARVLLVPLP